MPKITVVGCGLVGSVFTTEFTKRAYAGNLQVSLQFIDDDHVEERNAANQNYTLEDAGRPKAKVQCAQALAFGLEADWSQTRLTAENMADLLAGSDLIIDGVDNLATRQLLWGYGVHHNVPVLHIGVSEQQTGKVEWTTKTHDTFSLAPHRTIGKLLVDPKSGITPPCELVRTRGTALNIGMAAAVAVSLYYGFDAEQFLDPDAEKKYWLTDWASTPTGFFPMKELWKRVPADD